jgi:adenine-specific DNA methylase
MSQKQPKRLIEELLPLTQIGVESSKSIAKGDIHAIHTWFARRPLAACRAAAFASLVDAPLPQDERDELLRLIVAALPNKAPQERPDVIEEMRRRVRATFDDRAPRVLDPFAGGGSLALEAARLGCETHALDLNPNAVLTLLATVDYPMRFAATRFPLPPREEDAFVLEDAPPRTGNLVKAVEEWSRWVLARVRPQLAPYYQDAAGHTIIGYFWAKTVRCPNPNCGGEIPLLAQRWLSKRGDDRRIAYKLHPQPDRTLQVEILHGAKATADRPDEGTMARGSAQCPFCPTTVAPEQVKEQFRAGQDGRLLLVVAYKQAGESGTSFRAATDDDWRRFAEAATALACAEANHDDPFLPLVPDEPLPEQSRGNNLGRYGISNWGKAFNARQLLALSAFIRAIRDAYDAIQAQGGEKAEAQAVALYLSLALSRMSQRLSEIARWNNKRDTIESATAGHKLPMLWDYGETNPMSGGTGSWKNTSDWALESISRLLGAASMPVAVQWGDATKLPFDDNSFDAVLTDPPYYDSVSYSDLSDMQYVWLHRALGDILPEQFPGPLTPKRAEIIQENSRHGSGAAARAFFEERLGAALSEMRRVLRPDGVALVMYAHTETAAWEMLVAALINGGFRVTASWPINTETSSRQDWLGAVALQATIFLACRKRAPGRVGYLDEILPDMRREVGTALNRFWAAGIGGADFFISAIGPALSVFSRYDEVRYASGQRVSVANFLTLVRQAVVDHALRQALRGVDLGEVDRETQFALLWRWTYGHKEVETGAALLLDKATGVELGELGRRGLLGRVDDNKRMVLYGPEERPEVVARTLARLRGGDAPIIDVIHAAGLLWRDGRREELNELLATQDDATRRVAQALAEIQKNGHAERRLTLGFLGAWNTGLLARKRAQKPSAPDEGTQLPLAFDDND